MKNALPGKSNKQALQKSRGNSQSKSGRGKTTKSEMMASITERKAQLLGDARGIFPSGISVTQIRDGQIGITSLHITESSLS